jgi:hypothetical protein
MKETRADITKDERASDQEEATGLPLFKTWRGVYLFVWGCFILWVLLLVALTVSYS